MDVGVIGTGAMGRNHVRIYSELKSVDQVYLFDTNKEQAESIAAKNGVNMAQSLDELLRQVDAVSLCVPTPFHFENASKIIEKGVHLLIEKPICLNSLEGEKLSSIIPDDLIVGVGHIERFNPVVGEITKIIKEPLYVEFKRHNPASRRVTGSSVVEDLMIHDIDIMINCLFSGDYSVQSLGNFEIATALFSFNKVPVFLSASRKSSKKIRQIHIEQEDLTIQGDFMTQELYVYKKPEQYSLEDHRYVQENIVEKVMVNKEEPLKSELCKFIECIKQNQPFPITPKQAIENLKVCELITGGFA